MRVFTILVCSLLLNAGTVFGQTELVAQVKAELVAAGANLSGPCGSFRITNEVAKRANLLLLGKGAGNRAIPQPDGSCLTPEQSNQPGYADGYLIYPNGVGVDILGDAGGGNLPAWQYETAADMVARNLKNGKPPIPNLGSSVPNPGMPLPSPMPGGFDGDALARQMRIENQLLIAQVKLDALKEQLKEHDEHPSWASKVFGNRYVQMLIAAGVAYVTTDQVKKD